MNIALITAGGTGTRMNNNIPKQFLNIEDKPLIIYTLEKFQTHPSIDAICVTCLKGWQEILKAYALQFNITKLKWIVTGGATGQESIHNGLMTVAKECSEEDIIARLNSGELIYESEKHKLPGIDKEVVE